MKCTIKIFLICQLEWHSRREGGGGVEEEEREGGGGGGGWMGEFNEYLSWCRLSDKPGLVWT